MRCIVCDMGGGAGRMGFCYMSKMHTVMRTLKHIQLYATLQAINYHFIAHFRRHINPWNVLFTNIQRL